MSPAPEPSAAPALVVIDPDPAQGERLAAAAEALGAPVRPLPPYALTRRALAELASARAVVVAWNLGSRVGLDVVEALARDPATAAVPVALAADAPARVHVELAVRAGAATVVRRPLEPDEVAHALLGRAGGAPPADAAAAEAPAAPGAASEAAPAEARGATGPPPAAPSPATAAASAAPGAADGATGARREASGAPPAGPHSANEAPSADARAAGAGTPGAPPGRKAP